MDRKSKLEELIHRKRQEQEDEIQARKRPRDDEIDNIDFGDDSDEDVNPTLPGVEETGVIGLKVASSNRSWSMGDHPVVA